MAEERMEEPTARVPTDSIANRLILARHLAGHLSIREAAARCDIGRGAWQNWERGNSSPRINDVRAIADVLGVDLAWLANGGPLQPDGQPGAQRNRRSTDRPNTTTANRRGNKSPSCPPKRRIRPLRVTGWRGWNRRAAQTTHCHPAHRRAA